MTLDHYLKAETGRLTRLAAACGVTPGRITQIRQGAGCSATLALKIEAATVGIIDAATLSKDVASVRTQDAAA
jgi:DNA-binding transcriptional regulator YdaS (Cro superfamily)